MKTPRTKTHKRGFILIAVYMAAIFICLFSAVLFARQQVVMQATERYQNRVLAFNAAEAGIDSALRKLSNTQIETDVSSITSLGQHAFHYDISSPVSGASEIRKIVATGCAPDCTSSSRAYQNSVITVYCQLPPTETSSSSSLPLFKYGVYAKDSISMSGNSGFDSYNSKNGAYGGSNKSTDGTMAVDSTEIAKLSLNGNAKINGSVVVGYSGNTNIVVKTTGNATISGTRSTLAEDWSSPATEAAPEGATSVGLTVSGNNTITLAAGTYSASSISISGNAKIVTTGAVKIYVSGSISISGNGVVVQNNCPANFLLFSTGSSNVSISGNGSFYGGVYAPNSAVTSSGNGDIFGAVVAKTYTQSGNSATHFDLAMKTLEGSSSEPPPTTDMNAHITAWQELNSLAWGTGVDVGDIQ